MKIVTFGEIMLRLAPEGYKRFVQADKLCASYGGGEANVAVSLANLGLCSSFITKLPQNPVAQGAVNVLRSFGVDTSGIVRGGDRIGIYFLEKGASQRPSLVVYDRANSAIASATPEEFDWKKIFSDAGWFHFTGITPALSDNCARITLEACIEAKKRGITVSCDLNYRKKLWSREKAGRVMAGLMQYVDVVIANEEDAYDVFGIKADASNVSEGKISKEGYAAVAKAVSERFGVKTVAITMRGSINANDNDWSALLYSEGSIYYSRDYRIHIVDRVGGGDSFCAGLIYGLSQLKDGGKAVEFAAAASCLKHTVEGDFNLVSIDEINKLLSEGGNGRVQR